MKKALLLVGGVFHLIFGVFHVYLARVIQVSTSLPPENRPLMHVLNIAFAVVIFFFAYVSFFCQQDLLTTKLGKAALVLMALIYLFRAAAEFIFFQFSPFMFFPCLLVGVIYAVLLFLTPSPKEK